ncbi:MAG TPA: BlaI/MecI/CopY family transcriptional regulator [Mycobacteriales bacterium]|nr:BlaI/MecI/CopY family transcriptional regulator [Mycobacteriales bacterium]
MTAARRPAGALETEVLAQLWAADESMTPAQVQEALGGELAYTTVMTILSRLHEKGAVRRERAGRAFAYAPVLDENGLAAAKMRTMLEGGADRRAVLAYFVDGLSPEDGQALSALLDGSDRERG